MAEADSNFWLEVYINDCKIKQFSTSIQSSIIKIIHSVKMNKRNQQNDQSSRNEVDPGVSRGKKDDVSSKSTMNERALNTGNDVPLSAGQPGYTTRSQQQQEDYSGQQETFGQSERLGKQHGLGQHEKYGQQEQKYGQNRTDI
eukprot:TRINITY_DN14941_c0_g1_i1.p1 TRINITY_DN14941_c0_g1~~TRINITY_DN14941_c0_g1_i1.p1  ORF type:complete len:143 (-),score=31.07 TRINITY_DN14941_c0_g1_i1:5-433(-)